MTLSSFFTLPPLVSYTNAEWPAATPRSSAASSSALYTSWGWGVSEGEGGGRADGVEEKAGAAGGARVAG
jgi:hypothetical protein